MTIDLAYVGRLLSVGQVKKANETLVALFKTETGLQVIAHVKVKKKQSIECWGPDCKKPIYRRLKKRKTPNVNYGWYCSFTCHNAYWKEFDERHRYRYCEEMATGR